MGVRKAESPIVFDSSVPCKVTTMGNVIEVQMMQKKNHDSVILNVDKDHYCDKRTGEILKKNHIEHRGQDEKSLRKTFAKVRAIVNTNVTDPQKCLWCAFTYSQEDKTPMTDIKRLHGDFKRFWMRFKRFCTKYDYGVPEYISIAEPQGTGSWHLHVIFVWDKKAPFIPNEPNTPCAPWIPKVFMSELWGQGFTSTKKIDNCDNIGAYLSAYLGDMPLDEAQENGVLTPNCTVETKKYLDSDGTLKEKKFIKGGRLYLYPPGMNILRTSKGIKQPTVEIMSQKNAEKKVSGATETFKTAYEILDDDGHVINSISKAYYNTKRSKNQ